jgi:hypothetical protein
VSSAGVDTILFDGPDRSENVSNAAGRLLAASDRRYPTAAEESVAPRAARKTPRKSLIVVLPENHVVSPEVFADRLPAPADGEAVDVILACAGHPHSISALQHRVRDLQILLAPAGTSSEDLRELAMSQAPGDIVTLLSGSPLQA